MSPEDLLGQKLGPYHIEAILGSGGMATVYRARLNQAEIVALKILFPPPGAGPDLLDRFAREARTAARLRHPAIVPVLDVGQAGGHSYLAMPLIEGHSLAERLAEVERLDEATAADIAWQVADALDYAHSQGVIHRDVKPANILLTGEGRAMLTDFGVALALDDPVLTRTGYIVGTPAYLAPEQAAGLRDLDGRADIYALGVVLYHMLTGQMPFQGSTPQVLHAHLYDPPPAPSIWIALSPAMEAIVLKALAKETGQRFQTGAALAQALARLGPQPPTRADLAVPPTRTLPPKAYTTPNLPQLASPTRNPFFYGGAVAPDQFYGRRELAQTILQRFSAPTPQSISIVGERRIGKSSLLNYIQARIARELPAYFIVIYLDLMKAYCHTRAGLMKALRRTLTRLWREPWGEAEDGDLMAFDFAVEELQAEGKRLVLCLDEVEHLTERAEEFNDVLEDWRACGQLGQIALLVASAQPLADLCHTGGLTSPFYNIFAQYWLGLFNPEEWQALVRQNEIVTPEDLTFIDQIAGGHPFFTQVAASYLWEARAKNSLDYEQLYQELSFQLRPHLDYLWRNLIEAERATLRRVVGREPELPDPALLAGLARRGLVKADHQPFSRLLVEMI